MQVLLVNWINGLVIISMFTYFFWLKHPTYFITNQTLPNKDTLIRLQAQLDQPFYLATNQYYSPISTPDDTTKKVYVYLNICAGKMPAEHPTSPLNISLVLDRSGSMAGAKLRYAKAAANLVIDHLSKADFVSLVTYDDEVYVRSAAGSAKRKKKLKRKIAEMLDGGTTNLSGGMLEGFQQIGHTFQKGYVNRVLLMSDGLANKGITDPFKLQDTVQTINRTKNITLSTFGLGADFDEDLMEALAEYGGANYYFVAKAAEIEGIFKEELTALQSVLAQEVTVTIDIPNDYLALAQVYAYPYWLENHQLTLSLNDIFAEEQKGILLEFRVKQPIRSQISLPIQLHYQSLTAIHSPQQKDTVLTIQGTRVDSVYKNNFNHEVLQKILLFKANAALKAAIVQVDKMDYVQAKAIIDSTQQYLKEQFKTISPDTLLQKQYDHQVTYLKQIAKAKQLNEYEHKMMQKGAKSENYKLRKKPYLYGQ